MINGDAGNSVIHGSMNILVVCVNQLGQYSKKAKKSKTFIKTTLNAFKINPCTLNTLKLFYCYRNFMIKQNNIIEKMKMLYISI